MSAGEEIAIARHDEPVAVVVRPDTIRTRRAELDTARALSSERADELVAQGTRPSIRHPPPSGTLSEMDVDRIWSAAELEAMTPDERAATIRAGFVNDPARVPVDLADAARSKTDARIAATEGRQARQ